MRQASLALYVAVSIAMSGCSKHAVREGDRYPRARLDRGQMPADNPNRLYDDSGELLQSNLRIASLALPRGLTENSPNVACTVTTTVPAEKLQRYFGPRLITGSVSGLVKARSTAWPMCGALLPVRRVWMLRFCRFPHSATRWPSPSLRVRRLIPERRVTARSLTRARRAGPLASASFDDGEKRLARFAHFFICSAPNDVARLRVLRIDE